MEAGLGCLKAFADLPLRPMLVKAGLDAHLVPPCAQSGPAGTAKNVWITL